MDRNRSQTITVKVTIAVLSDLYLHHIYRAICSELKLSHLAGRREAHGTHKATKTQERTRTQEQPSPAPPPRYKSKKQLTGTGDIYRKETPEMQICKW